MPSRGLQSSSSDGDGFESSSTAPRCGQVIRGRGRGGLGLRGRGLRGRGRGHNIRGPPAIPSVPIESLEGAEIEKKEVSQVAKLEYDSRMEMATAPLGRITTEEKKDENKTRVMKVNSEVEKRQDGLQKPIDSNNKGFEMLVKMGYKAGETLGKSNSGSAELIDVKMKNDRKGLGEIYFVNKHL